MTRYAVVVTYFVLTLLPLALFGYDGPWPGRGEISIRDRRPFPDRLNTGAFEMLDKWLADRVGLRYPMIYMAAELHVGLLRRSVDHSVIFGRDDWLFYTDQEDRPSGTADVRGRLRFSLAELARIDLHLRGIGELAACGVPALVFVAPNKQSIYGEYLSAARPGGSATRLDHLLESLSERARHTLVDARPALRAAKAAHAPRPLYYKTDTHWNDLGGFYAYVAIMRALAREMPVPRPELVSLDRYRVTASAFVGGDMATRVLFSPWRFSDWNVVLEPAGAGFPEPVNQDGAVIYRNPDGQGRLVVIGDSFAGHLLQFLAQNFAELVFYPGVALDGAIIARHLPAAVVWELVERGADRLLHPPRNLNQVCAK